MIVITCVQFMSGSRSRTLRTTARWPLEGERVAPGTDEANRDSGDTGEATGGKRD